MLESEDELLGWKSADNSLPPLIPMASDNESVLSQQDLPSLPYEPIGEWLPLS